MSQSDLILFLLLYVHELQDPFGDILRVHLSFVLFLNMKINE